MRSIRKAVLEDVGALSDCDRKLQALFAKAGFLPSGMIHNLDPGDPEIVYFKAVNAGGFGAID